MRSQIAITIAQHLYFPPHEHNPVLTAIHWFRVFSASHDLGIQFFCCQMRLKVKNSGMHSTFEFMWKLKNSFISHPSLKNSIKKIMGDYVKYLQLNASIYNNSNSNNSGHNLGELPLLDALEFWPWQVLLICIYSATAFISLGSNIITIIVLLKGDRISSELWKFLINLSFSDITMSLFSIPFTYTNYMLNRWIFPTPLCPIVNFMQLCSVFVSVWTLTIIGIDRWVSIFIYF